jgi:uncharacterized membrane protein YeaQ/YmgE (transglycosylase-associated protein family)
MEELLLWEFPPKVREWATLLFFWSGVAIWIGLTARFLAPARVVRGPWLTLCLGFVGSCLGPFALRSFFKLERFDPIGPCGLVASVVVAVATLGLFYAVAFFFPTRFDDEEDENYEDVDDGKREKAGEADRRKRQDAPPRRQDYERDRVERRDWERGEYGRREYDYDEDEPTEERENARRPRPQRRR